MTAIFAAKAVEVADALANVLPHTDGDTRAAVPVLAAVQVDVSEDGLVTFAATDRYTLGTVEVVSVHEADVVPGTFLLHRRDAADVVKMAKAEKLGLLTFDHVDGHVTVGGAGRAVTRRLVEGDFPKWRSLLPEGKPVAVDVIGMGAGHLSKFAKMQRGGRTLKVATLVCEFRSAVKPIDVRVPEIDGFRAIVMPVRLPKADK